MTVTEETWLQGHYAPVHDELTVADLPVEGELPPGLRGSFLRNGPNPRFAPRGKYHIFDGDGMVHGLTLDGEGGASYANRWVRSPGFEAEVAAGEALFGGLSDFALPPDDVLAEVGPLKNTANTHVVRHANRILALMEAAPPMELAPDLSTVGQYDFEGALAGSMTAHPKMDPVTGEMVFIGYSPLQPYLRVHAADRSGALTWSTEIDLPGPVMMHDFVMTATRVVIFDLPAVFDLESLMTGGPSIYWAPDRGARVGVLERGAPGDSITWTDVDPFWVFHFLNAHDDGDAIEVTGCRVPRLNAAFGDDVMTEAIRPNLYRWRLDPGTGSFTTTQLDDQPTDFPRINGAREGLPHRYGYTGHTCDWNENAATFDGVIKHDLETGTSQSHRYGPTTVCGETVFAADPSSADEDGGWLLNYVHDLSTDRSAAVVLDAGTLDEVARVPLPQRVPFGFHGSFLPDPS